jgi:hypothetical protein
MNRLRERNAKVLAAIEDIKQASTADEANWACRNNGFRTFVSCISSEHEMELNGPLTKIWEDGCALYGSPTLPWPSSHLDRLKRALIDRLRIIYLPEPEWNVDAPLDQQAADLGKLSDLYPDVLRSMPALFIEKCWDSVRVNSPEAVAAATILFNYYSASIHNADLELIVDMKRLLDAVSGKLQSDIGHSIYSNVNRRLHEITKVRGLTIYDAKKDPLHDIERAYFGSDRTAESCLVGALLLAVFRSLTAESDSRRVRIVNLLFGLREAYGFLLAGRVEVAQETVEYCKFRIDELAKCAVLHERDWICQFCHALAIQANISADFRMAESMHQAATQFSIDPLEKYTTVPRFFVETCGWKELAEFDTSIIKQAEALSAKYANENNFDAAIALKRIFEISFRKGGADANAVACVISVFPQSLLHSRMTAKGQAWSSFKRDPLAAIEEHFFGNLDDRLNHLHAGILLSACRYQAASTEPTLYLASIFAIREAYAYYIAGASLSARDSLAWAKSVVDTVTPDDEREQSSAIGIALHATAVAARARDEFDDELDLLLHALRFLSLTGTERADALVDLAMAYERRNMVAEAIASYREVLLVPEVKDDTSQLVARTRLGHYRVEFESDASQLFISQQLDEKLGLKGRNWLEFLKRCSVAEEAGTPLSADEEIKGIEFGLVFARSLFDMNERCQAFSNLILPIRIGMSIDDPEKYPAPLLAQIFELADSLEAIGDPQDRLIYLKLRSVVEQNPRMKVYRAVQELDKMSAVDSPLRKVTQEKSKNYNDAV